MKKTISNIASSNVNTFNTSHILCIQLPNRHLLVLTAFFMFLSSLLILPLNVSQGSYPCTHNPILVTRTNNHIGLLIIAIMYVHPVMHVHVKQIINKRDFSVVPAVQHHDNIFDRYLFTNIKAMKSQLLVLQNEF